MINVDAAESLLVPYSDAVRDLFTHFVTSDGKLSKLAKTVCVVSEEVRDSPRHFGRCRDDGMLIELAPELAMLPISNVLAIIGHEFGHAADFAYPARFSFVQQSKPAVWVQRPDFRWWNNRTPFEIEICADAIVLLVTGRKISYTCEHTNATYKPKDCLIQTFEKGVARPEWLR